MPLTAYPARASDGSQPIHPPRSRGALDPASPHIYAVRLLQQTSSSSRVECGFVNLMWDLAHIS